MATIYESTRLDKGATMTYYSLIFKDYNVISFPKVGCTQVIKYCTDLEQYADHGHSYTSNTCLKNSTIHNCGAVLRSENKNFKYLIPVRYPHERILSYFWSNNGCRTQLDLDTAFQNHVVHNHSFMGHMSEIRLFKPKNDKVLYFHLEDLNEVWKEFFDIDHDDDVCINKSKYDKAFQFNDEQINLIKLKYRLEYEFLDSKLN